MSSLNLEKFSGFLLSYACLRGQGWGATVRALGTVLERLTCVSPATISAMACT